VDAGTAEQTDTQAQAAGTEGRPGDALPSDRQDAPLNEQQLALEQWLRQVPDDPAGLLRRKFMLEHLLRQKRTQSP
jgi:Ca-activated chloride channel family protein